jgi:hypothetical protein
MVKRITVCLLVTIFLLSPLAIINNVKPVTVSGYNTSMTWGHLNCYNFNSTEFPKQEKVCQAVSDMFYFNPYTWLSADCYGAWTTIGNVTWSLEKVADPSKDVDFTHVFWVGDYNPSAVPNTLSPYGNFGLFTNKTGQYVWDTDIYSRTTAYGDSKHYLTFMWTCVNGGLYWDNGVWQNVSGVTWPSAFYQYVYIYPHFIPVAVPNPCTEYSVSNSTYMTGMPLAWTGVSDMSIDGYHNPYGEYTYLGWENNSPFMGNKVPSEYTSKPTWEYSHFIYYFYTCATSYGNGCPPSINEALDYGAVDAFGKVPGTNYYFVFESSVLNEGQWVNNDGKWLYCKLRVLGNGALSLPY